MNNLQSTRQDKSLTVLITGATDGIGLALARQYRQRNARLILVGRKPLAHVEPRLFSSENYCRADLADPDCAQQIVDWLVAHQVSALNLVIHNAAVGYIGPLDAQTAGNLHELIAVNLFAPVALTHALFAQVARGDGKYVYISSAVSSLPSPDYAAYTATKAALEGFIRNLRIELSAAHSEVKAQIIRPGATRTNFHAKSGGAEARWRTDRFASPDRVAGQLIRAIDSDRTTVTLGLPNRALHWAGIYLPELVEKTAAARHNRQRGRAQQSRPNTKTATGVTRDRHCVITGAADGIGKALAQAFGEAGYVVTGIDVDTVRARQTQADLQNAGISIRFIIADLQNQQDLERALDLVAGRSLIDVIIHCAGINAVGYFIHSDLRQQQAVVAVNFTAPLHLTADLLRRQRFAPAASFVFISSLSHFVSYPGAAVYAATKDGLSSYAQSLAIALAPQGNHVVTVYPGPARTAHARRYSPDNRHEHRRMPPEVIARHVLAAVSSNKRIVIPGLGNRVFAALARIMPKVVETVMCMTILKKFSVR